MAQFVPPVTGTGGIASSIVANMHDTNRIFRSRTGSVKRRREDNTGLEELFDITRDYPPLVEPEKQHLDLSVVRSLLVATSAAARELTTATAKVSLDEDTRTVANACLSLYKLMEATIECALVPMAGGAAPTRGRNTGLPPPDPEENMLRIALEVADKSLVVFGSNLGTAQIGNRNTLSANFTNGLRDAAINKAGEDAAAAAESVRQVADALSCAETIDFIGWTSTVHRARGEGGEDSDGAAALPAPPTFYSMPVKLTFPDRESRIYFEQTIRKNCGVSSKMDLPKNLRTASAEFGTGLRAKHPGKIVVVKTDIRRKLFTAIAKNNGDQSWERLEDTLAITPAMMAGVSAQ